MKEGSYYIDEKRLYHSAFELEWLRSYYDNLDHIKTIIEFGSFDCGDGYRFKQFCPNAEVYSIEACPERFNLLKPLADKYGIKAFNYAVSDVDNQEIDFYQCLDPNEGDLKYGPAGSILQRTSKHTSTFSHLSYPPPIKVKSITLDTFCRRNSITKIDLLHIDIEGAEHKALLGLKLYRPTMIFLEKHLGSEWYGGGYVAKDMHSYMVELGYTLAKDLGCDALYVIS